MALDSVVHSVALALEAAGVAAIVVGTLIAATAGVRRLLGARPGGEVYSEFRRGLGRSILLGLEFLVAADIIETVALDLSFTSVGVLAIVVLIRTFLSFTLELEVTGRWPWQKRPHQE